MAPLDSNNSSGGPYRKPRADLYTVLLILALIAILLAIICLYLEMKMYDFEFKGAPVAASLEVSVTADVAGPILAVRWASEPVENAGPTASQRHRTESLNTLLDRAPIT